MNTSLYSQREISRARGQKKSQRKNNNSPCIIMNLENTKYDIFPFMCRKLGWKSCEEDDELQWDVYWTDSGQGIERLVRKSLMFQRINHFPGMVHIYRKSCLARSMGKMQRVFGDIYDFFPKTWILPYEMPEVLKYLGGPDEKCCIMKPSGGAQGKGIFLVLDPRALAIYKEDSIVQEYISRPLLIDGLKFDLRVYVLVTSCEPLRIMVYKDGLVRFCTAPYNAPTKENVFDTFMHLTNYSLNKFNSNFVQNNSDVEEGSSKRSIKWLMKWMEEKDMKPRMVWRRICDVIVKTMISIQASLAQNFKTLKLGSDNRSPFTCFEVLGFDVMLTDTLKPVLIEVNHTPSFRCDSALDKRIKEGLLTDTLKLLNVSPEERKAYVKRSSAISQQRLYGSTFKSASKEGGDAKARQKTPRPESTSSLWQRYRENEARCLGEFDLVYPTEEYPNQPTRGMQQLYDILIADAFSVYMMGGGASAFTTDETAPAVRGSVNESVDQEIRAAEEAKANSIAAANAAASAAASAAAQTAATSAPAPTADNNSNSNNSNNSNSNNTNNSNSNTSRRDAGGPPAATAAQSSMSSSMASPGRKPSSAGSAAAAAAVAAAGRAAGGAAGGGGAGEASAGVGVGGAVRRRSRTISKDATRDLQERALFIDMPDSSTVTDTDTTSPTPGGGGGLPPPSDPHYHDLTGFSSSSNAHETDQDSTDEDVIDYNAAAEGFVSKAASFDKLPGRMHKGLSTDWTSALESGELGGGDDEDVDSRFQLLSSPCANLPITSNPFLPKSAATAAAAASSSGGGAVSDGKFLLPPRDSTRGQAQGTAFGGDISPRNSARNIFSSRSACADDRIDGFFIGDEQEVESSSILHYSPYNKTKKAGAFGVSLPSVVATSHVALGVGIPPDTATGRPGGSGPAFSSSKSPGPAAAFSSSNSPASTPSSRKSLALSLPTAATAAGTTAGAPVHLPYAAPSSSHKRDSIVSTRPSTAPDNLSPRVLHSLPNMTTTASGAVHQSVAMAAAFYYDDVAAPSTQKSGSYAAGNSSGTRQIQQPYSQDHRSAQCTLEKTAAAAAAPDSLSFGTSSNSTSNNIGVSSQASPSFGFPSTNFGGFGMLPAWNSYWLSPPAAAPGAGAASVPPFAAADTTTDSSSAPPPNQPINSWGNSWGNPWGTYGGGNNYSGNNGGNYGFSSSQPPTAGGFFTPPNGTLAGAAAPNGTIASTSAQVSGTTTQATGASPAPPASKPPPRSTRPLPRGSSRSNSPAGVLQALVELDLDAPTKDRVLNLEVNAQGLVKLTPEALALQLQLEESRLRLINNTSAVASLDK